MASCAPIIAPMACPSSGVKYGPIHASGISTTPSRVMNSPATIFLIVVSSVWEPVLSSGLLLTLRTGTGRMDTTGKKTFRRFLDALPDDGQRRRPPAGRAALRRDGALCRGADQGRGAA